MIILNHYGRKSINDDGNIDYYIVQSKKMGEEYKEDRTCMFSSFEKLYKIIIIVIISQLL